LLLGVVQLLGAAELVYGALGGLAWADFVVGGVTVIVGLLGLHAGFQPSVGSAKRVRPSSLLLTLFVRMYARATDRLRVPVPGCWFVVQYFWALIVVAVLMVTVLVVYIIVLDRGYWEELCEKEKLKFGSLNECDSNTTRYVFVAAAIVQLLITMACCVRALSLRCTDGVCGSRMWV
jgi:hypothetical protein